MADITTEMNMPIISAPALGVTGDVTASMAPAPEPVISYDDASDATIAVGSPAGSFCASDITIYSNSITPVQYNGSDEVACFDVVFSVGINCDGVSKTYQVVKRIGIDKCKIAQEASCSTPVSIVESKSEALKEEAAATRKRFRRLAGLE
jgi:hypothetical protein